MTISGIKPEIGVPGITIVEMICDYDEQHSEWKKVRKILIDLSLSLQRMLELLKLLCITKFIVRVSLIAAPPFALRKHCLYAVTNERMDSSLDACGHVTTSPRQFSSSPAHPHPRNIYAPICIGSIIIDLFSL